jgi:hypothetical protein
MTVQIGANPAETLTSAERITSGKGWSPGDRYTDHQGYEWVYVKAGATPVAQNYLVKILSNFETTANTTATRAFADCHGYAVAASASIASASFGWVMVRGVASVKVAATGTLVGPLLVVATSATPGAVIVTATTTAGQVRLTGIAMATNTVTVSTAALTSAGISVRLMYPMPFVTIVA